MSEPFESEVDRDQSLEETCAGLVYADTRTLDRSELKRLHRAKWRYIGAGAGLGLLALAVLFALLLFLMALPEESAGPYLYWTIPLVIGAPTVLVVFAFKSMERAEPLRSVLKDGRVRIYKGHLNLADPTDANLHFLRKAGLLQDIDAETEVSIEFPLRNELVYRFNERIVPKQVTLDLTRAVPRPSNPIVLDAPADWFEGDTADGAERRRLSAEEEMELRSYLSDGWRYWAKVIGGSWLLAALLWKFLAWATAQVDAARLVAISIAVLLLLRHVYNMRRGGARIRADAELGWLIITTVNDDPDAPMVEWLPVSRLVWTINGKPAGWRKMEKS